MSLQDEIVRMEIELERLVTATLSRIRKNLSGNDDFVLVDNHDNFKNFFLDTVKTRITKAYNAYVLQALKSHICIEAWNNKIAAETQETMVSQSTVDDDDYIESQGSTVMYSSLSDNPNSLCADISTIQKIEEVQLQKQFRSSVYILGLPIRGGDRNSLLKLFKILCNHLFEPFDDGEIEDIRSDGRFLTVSYHSKYKRDQLLRCRRAHNLKSDQVLKLQPGEVSMLVKIRQRMTKFYQIFASIAQSYVGKKCMYNYRVTDKGLGIKLSRDSEILYVRSPYELREHILRNRLFKEQLAGPPSSSKRIKSNESFVF